MKLLNAYSLNMLDADKLFAVTRVVTAEWVSANDLESCVGHTDTAGVLSSVLNRPIENKRVTIRLERGEEFIVAQYIGPRLPEGCTSLPEGGSIVFYHGLVCGPASLVYQSKPYKMFTE